MEIMSIRVGGFEAIGDSGHCKFIKVICLKRDFRGKKGQFAETACSGKVVESQKDSLQNVQVYHQACVETF